MTKNEDIYGKILIGSITLLLMLSSLPLAVIGTTTDSIYDEDTGSWQIDVSITNLDALTYNGRLRVYIVEPVSRWDNYDGEPFHFGLLDFAINEEISIDDTYTRQVMLSSEEFTDMPNDNVMVIAAVFNSTAHEQYAYPPDSNPFDAYYVDAAAAAEPGSTGSNTVTENYTHTVFCEEGVLTGCPHCPAMADALYQIYESGDCPFYFVSLIWGKNDVTDDRLTDDFNMGVAPTAFFDGGYEVLVGGYSSESYYRARIETCGQRDVHELDMSVSFQWHSDLVFPPSVTIEEPGNGLYLFNEKVRNLSYPFIIGSFSIEASAYDNESSVDYVEFYINGEKRKTDSFAPYRFPNWDEKGLFGKYTIKAVAYDKAGNQNSDEITVWRLF